MITSALAPDRNVRAWGWIDHRLRRGVDDGRWPFQQHQSSTVGRCGGGEPPRPRPLRAPAGPSRSARDRTPFVVEDCIPQRVAPFPLEALVVDVVRLEPQAEPI